VVDERPGERHALHLPTRELAGLGVLPAGELDELESLRDAGLDLLGRDLAALESEGDIPLHVEMLEQGVALEHRVDVAPVGRNVPNRLAVEVDAARGRLLEAGHHAQGGGLSAPRRAEQGEELAALDRQVEVVDGDRAAERLRHALEADRLSVLAHALSPPISTVSSSRRPSSRGRATAMARIKNEITSIEVPIALIVGVTPKRIDE
jgi:hypothetical protein